MSRVQDSKSAAVAATLEKVKSETMKRRPVAVFGWGGLGTETAFRIYEKIQSEGFKDYAQTRLFDTVPATSTERQKIYTSMGGVNTSKLVAEDCVFEFLFASDKLLTNATLGAGKKRRDGQAAIIASHQAVEDSMRDALSTLLSKKADKQTEHITGIFILGSGGGTGSGSIHTGVALFRKIATEEFNVKSVWVLTFVIMPDCYVTGGGEVDQSVRENAYSLLSEINYIQMNGFNLEVKSRNISIATGALSYDLIVPLTATDCQAGRSRFEDLRDLIVDYVFYSQIHPAGALRFQENFMDSRRALQDRRCQGKPRLNGGINCHVLKMDDRQKIDVTSFEAEVTRLEQAIRDAGTSTEVQRLESALQTVAVPDTRVFLHNIGIHPDQLERSLQDIMDQEDVPVGGGSSQEIKNAQSMVETIASGLVAKFTTVNIRSLGSEIWNACDRMSLPTTTAFLANLRQIFENARVTVPNPNDSKGEIANLLALIEPEEKKVAFNDKKQKASFFSKQKWQKDQKVNTQLPTWVAEAGTFLGKYAKTLFGREMANFYNNLLQNAVNIIRSLEREYDSKLQATNQQLQAAMTGQTTERIRLEAELTTARKKLSDAKDENADIEAQSFSTSNPKVQEFIRLFQDEQDPQLSRQGIYVDAGTLSEYFTILCPDKWRADLEAMVRPLKNGKEVVFYSAPNSTIVFIREEIGIPLHDLFISEKLQEAFMKSEIKREVWSSNNFVDCPALCPAAEDKARQLFAAAYFCPIRLDNLRKPEMVTNNDPIARFTSTDARILYIDGIWKARGSRREVVELTDVAEVTVAMHRFAENLSMVTSIEDILLRQIQNEEIRAHLIATVLEGTDWLETTFNELENFVSTVDLTDSDADGLLEAEQILLEEKKALAEKYDALIRELEGFCVKKFRKELECTRKDRERQEQKKAREEKKKKLLKPSQKKTK